MVTASRNWRRRGGRFHKVRRDAPGRFCYRSEILVRLDAPYCIAIFVGAIKGVTPMTAFGTFLTALGNAAERDGVLGNECVEYPPSEEVDYWATPLNAVVFGWMGVDGVHYAILKVDGEVRDSSPVIQISPMDFDEPYSLLAPTFVDYLAIGCGVTRSEIEGLIALEESGRSALLDFMRANFQQSRFWADHVERDVGRYATMIVQKPDDEPVA